MTAHDKKIADLLIVINEKKKTIGTKPRASWKSNGILKFDDGSHVNINVVNDMRACVNAVAYMLGEQSFQRQAAELLDVPFKSQYDDYLEDFKLRASILKWDEEKRKLDVLEKKLKDLRSEDAKTEDALSDILQELQ